MKWHCSLQANTAAYVWFVVCGFLLVASPGIGVRNCHSLANRPLGLVDRELALDAGGLEFEPTPRKILFFFFNTFGKIKNQTY